MILSLVLIKADFKKCPLHKRLQEKKAKLILNFEHSLLWMYSIDIVESEKDCTK